MKVTDHPFKDLNSRKETAIRTDKGGVFFFFNSRLYKHFMLRKSSVKWKLHPLEMVISGGNQWNIVWGETLLLQQEDESLAAAASLRSGGPGFL